MLLEEQTQGDERREILGEKRRQHTRKCFNLECFAAGPPTLKPKVAAAFAVNRAPNQCLLCDVAPAQYTCKTCKKKACKRHVVEGSSWLSATCLTCAQQWLGTDSYSAAKDLKQTQTRKHTKDRRDRK